MRNTDVSKFQGKVVIANKRKTTMNLLIKRMRKYGAMAIITTSENDKNVRYCPVSVYYLEDRKIKYMKEGYRNFEFNLASTMETLMKVVRLHSTERQCQLLISWKL